MPDPVLRVLHLTDTHLHASPGETLRGVNTNASLSAVVGHVLRSGQAPDLVLATGDLVQDDSRRAYEWCRELLGALDAPVHCLAGNHDVPALMHDVLGHAPFRMDHPGRHGPWTILMLDTRAEGEAFGRVSPEALRRLDGDLAAEAGQHVLIALHHQPVPMGSAWLDSVGLRNAPELWEVLDRHEHVRCLLWGHVHQASDRLRGGVRLLSSPSTCAQFLPGAERFATDTRPPACRWLELHADGSIRTWVEWVELASR